MLRQLLAGQRHGLENGDLLVGLDPYDDAAVIRLSDEVALVSTTDFFPPLVDGPLILSAVSTTALAYLDHSADQLPLWRMATASAEALQARAHRAHRGRRRARLRFGPLLLGDRWWDIAGRRDPLVAPARAR